MNDELKEYQQIQDDIYKMNWNNIYASEDYNNMKEEISNYQNSPTNYVEINTYNNEYKVVFSKTKKAFSTSEFGQYNCTIEFRNSINNPIVTITTTEKEFLQTAEEISLFLSSYGSIYDSVVHFGDNNNTFWFFFLSYCNMEGEYPTEEDDMVSISLYSNTMNQGNKLRICFNTLSDFLQEFTRCIYQILVDIPYIDNMISATISEIYNRWYNGYDYI